MRNSNHAMQTLVQTGYHTAAVTHSSSNRIPDWVPQVTKYMIDHFADDLSLDDLANSVDMSKFNFCRQFHRHQGMPPLKWLWRFRAILASELLKLSLDWTIEDIALSCGFTSCPHFSRVFKLTFHLPPSRFRSNHRSVSKRRTNELSVLNGLDCPLVERATAKMSDRGSL